MSALARIGLVGVAFLAACTIRVQQSEREDTPDAECLELFETCVELAGESPGCTEVYQFCAGSVVETGSGGVSEVGDCEQTYIDCLEQGVSPSECQPLLDMCMPPEPETTTGPCEPGDPECPIGDVTGIDPTDDCPPDDPDCVNVNACEENFLNCISLAEESVCLEIQDACQTGDCQQMINVCQERLGDTDLCQQLTGCFDEPMPDDCEQLLSDCESSGLTAFQCSQQWPERPECFPEIGQCEWYSSECQQQFFELFCSDAGEACAQGWLPEFFDCSEFFSLYCTNGGLSDMACANGQNACQTGFFDTEFCAQTRIYEDPYQWLQELAECNSW